MIFLSLAHNLTLAVLWYAAMMEAGRVGSCRYCEKPAGMMRSVHSECADRHREVKERVPKFFADFVRSNTEATRFRDLFNELCKSGWIKGSEAWALSVTGFSRAVDAALEDGLVTEAEEERISALKDAFGIRQDDAPGAFMKVAQANILRSLDAGQLPTNVKLGDVPILFQKGEQPIWLFNGVTLSRFRTRTSYVGGSQGVSLRVMRGVYYRVGSSRGERVQTSELTEIGRGAVILTTRNLYFVSSAAPARYQLAKIVSVEPFADGFSVTRDGANAKPEFFAMSEPWFAVNAILKTAAL